MAGKICKIMLKEHKRIYNIFEKFKESVVHSDYISKEIKELFMKFKWNLEKHFFIEEKVIFTMYSSTIPGDSDNILRLLKEHKDMLWITNKIEEDIDNDIVPKFMRLSELLQEHADFEDCTFYPQLEERLSEKEKKLIIDRAKEVVK